MYRLLIIVFVIAICTGCGGSAPIAQQPTSIPTVAPPTAIPTVMPTMTPSPTATPEPSPTPVPSPTPEPTAVPPTPVPVASAPVHITIGAIGIDRSLVSVGLDRNNIPIVPNHDIGWYNLSAKPGQGDNIVLWGHVLRFKNAPNIPAPFARLKELGIGAKITLQDEDGKNHMYAVTKTVWVTPDQVEYVLPQGHEVLTMVSCIGNEVIVSGSVEMTHRLITIAEPVL